MPSASFTFSGSAGSLARLDATAASSVVATVDDTTGLLTITWSVEATDDSGGTYTLVASGPKGSICTFTSGAVGTGGLLVCTATTATGTLTAKAKWQVKTAAGYDILVVGEQFEHDSSYGWTGPINNVLRNMVASASTFADNSFRVYGSSDSTKRLAFEVDGLTTATTRTVTIPDKNGTLAMTSDILGPTFADNVFRITGSADATKLAAFEVDGFTTGTTRTFTLPNASATVSCLSVSERFTGTKTFDDATCILAGSSSGQVTLKAAAAGGSVVATFPASSGTVMYTSGLGSITDDVFIIQDDGDATKQLAFQCSGITTGNKRTLTVPDASGTITCDGVASTFSAAKTFTDGMCILAGSSSGGMTLKAPAVASTYVATFPAATGTVSFIGLAETVSGVKTFSDGSVVLSGSSSGTTTVKANATAGSTTATFPAQTGIVILDAGAQTFTGAKTFTDSTLLLAGSSSGVLTLKAPAVASTYVATLPAATGTIDLVDFAATFSAAKTFGDGNLKLSGSSSGTMTVKAPAAASTYTVTMPAATTTLMGTDTTDVVTGKTFDTAGAGNVFKINGTTISAVTGSGSAVLATSPSLTTPTIGVATATSVNKVAITAPATSATLTIADGTTYNVNVSAPAAGQHLRYNGTSWVNAAAITVVDAQWIKETTDAAASTTTNAIRFFTAPETTTITDVYANPRGSATSDATDYASVVVERWNSAGVSQGVVATGSTTPSSAGAMVNLAKWSLGAITNATMAAGDYLTVAITKTGVGRQLPRFQVYCARTVQV